MAELLAPAGTFEKLRWAVAWGADAVYFGVKQFSLRSFAGNFTVEEAADALSYLHARRKRGYITLNIYPFDREYEQLIETARALEAVGADAFIVADLGVFYALKQSHISTPLHISTQANTLSAHAAVAWRDLGAKRVNLARELSYDHIVDIRNRLGDSVETEVFIHGSVCFSYSGRCAISDWMTGRRANRGECTHPCRWNYRVEEEKRPGQYFPVMEDERGLYIFNSKDLALFPFVRPLVDAGITSFKIEGRMKSVHYLATVLSLYRRVLDGEIISEEEGMEQLFRVNSRGFSYGFMKGNITPEDYLWEKSTRPATAEFLGNIVSSDHSSCKMEIRNKTFAGETVEILETGGTVYTRTLPTPLLLDDGSTVDAVSHSKTVILPFSLPEYTIVRRVSS